MIMNHVLSIENGIKSMMTSGFSKWLSSWYQSCKNLDAAIKTSLKKIIIEKPRIEKKAATSSIHVD